MWIDAVLAGLSAWPALDGNQIFSHRRGSRDQSECELCNNGDGRHWQLLGLGVIWPISQLREEESSPTITQCCCEPGMLSVRVGSNQERRRKRCEWEDANDDVANRATGSSWILKSQSEELWGYIFHCRSVMSPGHCWKTRWDYRICSSAWISKQVCNPFVEETTQFLFQPWQLSIWICCGSFFVPKCGWFMQAFHKKKKKWPLEKICWNLSWPKHLSQT